MGTMSDVYPADGRVDVYPADTCRHPQGTHRTDCVGPRHPLIITRAILQGTNVYFYFSGPYW